MAKVTLAIAAVGVTVALGLLVPYRTGLSSLALYAGPAAISIVIARSVRGRRRVGMGLAALAGLLVIAVPFGYLQRQATGALWLAQTGVPRDLVQVVTVNGMTPDPYQWDSRAGVATEFFESMPADWSAIETTTRRPVRPCGTLDYPTGDAYEPKAPTTCHPDGPGLWVQTSADGIGLVRRVGGVTITLTADTGELAALRTAILGARPASDGELWWRTDSVSARATFITA